MELLHRGALRRLHKAFPTGFSPRYGTGGAGRCRTGCEQLQAPASWGASRASSGWVGLRMREAGARGQAVREAMEAVIADIHAGPHRAVIYTTGGGAQALSWLLATPGASNTVLEAGMPYARESLCDILGQEPQQFASGETALQMSKAAFKRAADLSAFGVQLVGVGCAAALMSHEPRRGPHRCYVAVTDGSGSRVMSLVLRKGLRTRVEEDGVVSQLMIRSLASACGLSPPASVVELQRGVADDGEEVVVEEAVPCPEPLGELLAGRASCLEVVGNNVLLDTPRHGRVMLPGSFNPLHVGHRGLLEAACKQAGVQGRGCFELAILNADKGMLSREEVERRITQFQEAGLPLVLTQAPIFTQKARLFPNTHFVVGHDTAVRLVMPKYYDNSHAKMVAEFSVLRNNGCSFLVAGRKDKDSTFKTFQDIPLPAELKDLFEGIPEDAFRKDISSTELRRRLAEKRAAAKRALAS